MSRQEITCGSYNTALQSQRIEETTVQLEKEISNNKSTVKVT